MPTVCAVFGCYSNARKKEVSFFRFPRDEETRQKWVHRCKRRDNFNTTTHRICSKHFADSAYRRDLKQELLGSQAPAMKYRRLKRNAIPTLHMPDSQGWYSLHFHRYYLLGKEASITGNNYNSIKECDSSNMSEGMFSKEKSCENNGLNETELEKELMISAMVFASSEDEKMPEEETDNVDTEFAERTSENVADEEGLRYVGGYVASKFPEYQFLGCKLKKLNGTWISAVERHEDNLTEPSAEFFEKLKLMEKLFKTQRRKQTETRKGSFV
ncbi:uncharacterized protein [Macrobrachium rosenbergii]|uniref:uncharacterized protein n=1 Tax=Macrobrachium rosenbergii TaxID=79674 RepID=UPI0034D3EAA7